jgi:DNA-3-methyladenine glycosylase II
MISAHIICAHMMFRELTLTPDAPFSLEMIRTFQCGLFNASRSCTRHEEVRLAFTTDDEHQLAGVALSHDARGRVRCRVFGAGDTIAVKRQVERILGLDASGKGLVEVLESDPELRPIAQAYPGFRPVVFYSTWAAAGWAVLSQRMPKARAASLARQIALESGDVVEIDGEPIASFPRPQTLLEKTAVKGLSGEKLERLRGLARAAVEGELAIEKLKALPYPEARERLMKLRGVGPWTADAVLIRGLGPTDVLPKGEGGLDEAVALAYGPGADLERVSERWRPFRTWVSILLLVNWYRRGAKA